MACARGKRVAQRVAGSNPQDPVFHLPIYRAPLEFPNLFNLVRAEAFAPSADWASASCTSGAPCKTSGPNPHLAHTQPTLNQ